MREKLKDRLPYEALCHIEPERLAATLIDVWRDVDSQQSLLDTIGENTGTTGLMLAIQTHDDGAINAIICGPYEQINKMGPTLFRKLTEWFKLAGLALQVTSLSEALPGKPKPTQEQP